MNRLRGACESTLEPGLCQGVCACPLSAVERPGGGRQGAEFDHRDGDPSNGHITNFQLLCLTCHEAKTAIQRAEECVPVGPTLRPGAHTLCTTL
eukprot:scaffold53473_cov98-Phaeocystis_antarctica.AAC.1